MAKVCLETIIIMGQWASSAFLRYIHIQFSDINKVTSTLTKNKKSFYTIPETEIVYHILGQDTTELQKSEPIQTRTITYNFPPLATALKWSPRKEIPRH